MYIVIKKKRTTFLIHRVALSSAVLLAVVLIYIFHLSIVRYIPILFKNNGYNPISFITNNKSSELLPAVVYKRHYGYQAESEEVAMMKGKYPVVPNSVHYLRVNAPEFSFTDAVCMLSAYKNHVPSKIYIHTSNSSFSGLYWKRIKETKGLRLIIKFIPLNVSKYIHEVHRNITPSFIYNFLKLRILAEYGGIALDKDIFVVNNLDKYLNYETTLHRGSTAELINDRIIIAKHNSSFLKLWLEVYHSHRKQILNSHFQPLEYATNTIFKEHHSLVHIDFNHFAVSSHTLDEIYHKSDFKWQKKDVVWVMEDLVTLEIKHKVEQYASRYESDKKNDRSESEEPEELNEDTSSVKQHKNVFLEMINDVYY